MFRPFPGFEILVTRVDRYRSRLALDCSGGPCPNLMVVALRRRPEN
jgi:hypothetical protein